MEIEDLAEETWDFIVEYKKAIIIFLILSVLGISTILYQTIDELKETEVGIKEDLTTGIVDTFVDVGVESSKTIEDPILRGEIVFLWWFLGILFVLMIIIAIGNAFKQIYEALNPWNIAKSMAR